MSDQGNPIWPEDLAVRGSLLPLGRTQQGELTLAWPGAVRDTVNSAYNALMAPGVALTGREARGAVPAGSFNPLAGAVDITSLMMGLGYGGGSLLERNAGGTTFGSFRGYHGTPHTFEPVEHNPFGEFRDTAIGTGEGAQVYGYGHYVAGNKATAEEYQKQLSTPEIHIDGKPLNMNDPVERNIANALGQEGAAVGMTAQQAVDTHKFAIASLYENAETAREIAKRSHDSDTADIYNREAEEFAQAAERLKTISPNAFSLNQGGNLLHLEIRPEEHELLDWDLPLSQQHPVVQQRLQPLLDAAVAAQQAARQSRIAKGTKFTLSGGTVPLTAEDIADLSASIDLSNKTGQNIYRMIGLRKPSGEVAAGPEEGGPVASAALAAAGIPGIKYLDAGSRRIKDPATYPGELTPQQQLGLDLINRSGQGAAWEAGGPEVYHSRLLSNYQQTLSATPEKYISRGSADLKNKIEALKSLDPSKLVGPPRSSNYVIFNPKDIRIIGRNGETLTMSPVDHDPFQSTK